MVAGCEYMISLLLLMDLITIRVELRKYVGKRSPDISSFSIIFFRPARLGLHSGLLPPGIYMILCEVRIANVSTGLA